jgi:pimeloyl-ACP methyl ester carboxylesterase
VASDKAEWRAPELGQGGEVEVTGGTIRYHESGTGPPLVLVHGLLVNANLWRKVVARLAPDFRCVSLELPLGSHLVPMPEADLSPPGLAGIIADAIEGLGLEDVTLVGNDTGGALCQLVATRRPERLGRLVLTSCDAFDNFPPTMFKWSLAPARLPGPLPIALVAPLRFRAPRRLPFAFGWLTHEPIDPQAEDSYLFPALTDAGARADLRRVLRGVNPSYTQEAAERLKAFDKPLLAAWARDDRFCPPEHAERLAALVPDGRLEWIEDSYTFTPEDQPERLAELIASFAREPRGEGAHAAR